MLTPVRKRSDYHHGDLGHAAIRAAKNLIDSEGLNSLGIRRVAEATGVSPAALYRHFENLEQLKAEVSAQIRLELGEFLKAKRDRTPLSRSKSRNALIRFEALGEAYIDYARKHPRLFEIAFIHCDEKPISEFADLAWELLQESIKELDQVGLLDRKIAVAAPMIAWSSVHGLAVLVAQRAILQREQDQALRQIMDGVERALGAR
ncbi:MAG: TetR/AcrR family transcriptional regulator [Candidatus Nanopelagicaceae bacterium]|jgi:AcrR family transcriptional regulator|nr:TetR/AcrR family transcriptional regulator [Actinomycetota bacterium]NCV95644.1 TetR/AcrR family transcriptional regulator [Actinomycetota bacterium]NCW46825.1 TetR/AcrR family transcriptional regulator [Actinomycetota bacterium]NCW75171.1 TetR/AcrR family transcriptional regulator [Actinomycetota bacterium]NCX33136.1 TetR/AcrR family transcriptional regulator [Actinomycetota bacterium]